MTRGEAIKLMRYVGSMYPSYHLPDESIEGYLENLRPLPSDAATESARRHIRQSRFFPTIAELVEGVQINRKSLQQRASSIAGAENLGRVRAGIPWFTREELERELAAEYSDDELRESAREAFERVRAARTGDHEVAS